MRYYINFYYYFPQNECHSRILVDFGAVDSAQNRRNAEVKGEADSRKAFAF